MADYVDLGYALRLAPKDAVAYFEGKGLRLSDSWTDLWEDAHAKSFTVARVARMDVLKDIHDAAGEVLRKGHTERWFQQHLTPILQAKGWWGKAVDKATGEVLDSYPGTSRPVEYGSPRRLTTIFRTNVQTAYMAGRYKHMMETSHVAPYWRYTAVMDQRTRASHAALHGKVFRHDDPIWDAIYPPNGFRCRCRVDAFTPRALDRRGLKVESSAGQLSEATVKVGGADRTVTVWRGRDVVGREAVFRTDPGWNYNPGKAAFPDVQAATSSLFLSPMARDEALAGIILSQQRRRSHEAWVDRVVAGERNAETVVGYIASSDAEFMRARGHEPAGVTTLEGRLIKGPKADRHEKDGDALTTDEWKALPVDLVSPQSTVYDTISGNLLYIYPSKTDDRKIKVVVRVGFEKGRQTSDSVRSAHKRKAGDILAHIQGGQWIVIRGDVE